MYKPKREYEARRWKSIRVEVAIGILLTICFVGMGIALSLLTVHPPTELELTATAIVAVNCTGELEFDRLPDTARELQAAVDLLDANRIAVNEVLYTHGALNSDGSECMPGHSDIVFDLTVEVDSLSNVNALTNSYLEIFDTINSLFAETLPTPRRILKVQFVTDTDIQNLCASFDDLTAARENRLTGDALLEALDDCAE